MNQGFRPNAFCRYGSPNQQPPFNGMFQHRQPGHVRWNQPTNPSQCHGRFQGRFSSRHQQYYQAAPGIPGNPRPHFHNFHSFQPRQNFQHNQCDTNYKNKQVQHVKRRNQKKKIDKRELPENNKFFCDTCDRGFCSDEKFQEHVSGHEKCSDPSCSYVAAPKLVKLHFQMQHRTGLARKIWQVESPEDIKRWIEERKRNFPTAANIQKKKVLQAERLARGEKLETKTFGKMGRGHTKQRRHGNRKRHFDSCQSQNEADDPPAKRTQISSQSSSSSAETSRVDDPLLAILQQPHPEPKEDKDSQLPPGGVNVAGGLASIMASYTDSDTEESPKTSPVKHKIPPRLSLSSTTKEQKDVNKSPQNLKSKQRRNQRKKNIVVETFGSKKPTLLEQLLAKEIRHERNVLLQCVHYIVKKNFFGVQMDGKKSSAGS